MANGRLGRIGKSWEGLRMNKNLPIRIRKEGKDCNRLRRLENFFPPNSVSEWKKM